MLNSGCMHMCVCLYVYNYLYFPIVDSMIVCRHNKAVGSLNWYDIIKMEFTLFICVYRCSSMMARDSLASWL